MKYAGLINNDVVNGYDVCVSVWVQGCPFRCQGCHNPQTWGFNDGESIDEEVLINNIISAIPKNNIYRNISILGGEPLCDENISFVNRLLNKVSDTYPQIVKLIWTGYTWEELSANQKKAISLADILIEGRFLLNKRDITLPLRGSSNQRIIDIQRSDNKIVILNDLENFIPVHSQEVINVL